MRGKRKTELISGEWVFLTMKKKEEEKKWPTDLKFFVLNIVERKRREYICDDAIVIITAVLVQ